MKLNVYCYFNKLLQAFGNFQLDDHEPVKVCEALSRDLRAQVIQGKAENLKYLDLYVLGVFDDEKGTFENKKELLLDLGALIAQLQAQLEANKEEEKDG